MKKKRKGTFTPIGVPLRVGRSKTGLGLFALEPIRKGACIIEYTGRRISKKEEETSRSKYLFEVNAKKTIDGASRKNKARYINHSCGPNCEIRIRTGRVFVMALRNIRAGEELTYDYDEEYFNEYIRPKGCKCTTCKSKKRSLV
jgi:SET domain-containing protein